MSSKAAPRTVLVVGAVRFFNSHLCQRVPAGGGAGIGIDGCPDSFEERGKLADRSPSGLFAVRLLALAGA